VSALLGSGRVLDAVLACIVLELLGLLAWRLLRREHAVQADVYLNMVSAAGLLLAAHAVLAAAWWGLTGLCLSASLVAHLAALRLRWRQGLRPAQPERTAHTGLESPRPTRR
jgi:hypothetical protein